MDNSTQNMGRPTVMTDLVLKKLEEAFAWGCSDKEACIYADISEKTLYNYQDKNEDFLQRKELLKERPVLLARKTVVENLEKNPNLALKFLERKAPKEFNGRAISKAEEASLIDLLHGEHKVLGINIIRPEGAVDVDQKE